MSTPTTATATLPHYNPHHFPYSHHQHQPYPQANTSSYRSANSVLTSSSRIAFPSPAAYSTSSSHSGINGISSSSSSSARPLPQEPTSLASLVENKYSAMPASSQPLALPEPQLTRKRRRSREPDWNSFYKNGLPKEIIVIDDTPEPEGPAASASSHTATNGHTNGIGGASNEASTRHQAKRRKRDDEPAHYDPVYNNIVDSHTYTPRLQGSPSKSTTSSDRTNSAIHTTAATSLGSLSSNGHYDYDAQAGQKRKRTTRQQIANEAKRREAGALTDAYTSYRPPVLPPKKAADVHVKVIQDVRCPAAGGMHYSTCLSQSQTAHSKNIRVDDDDGHYIVVPDNDLTDRCKFPCRITGLERHGCKANSFGRPNGQATRPRHVRQSGAGKRQETRQICCHQDHSIRTKVPRC